MNTYMALQRHGKLTSIPGSTLFVIGECREIPPCKSATVLTSAVLTSSLFSERSNFVRDAAMDDMVISTRLPTGRIETLAWVQGITIVSTEDMHTLWDVQGIPIPPSAVPISHFLVARLKFADLPEANEVKTALEEDKSVEKITMLFSRQDEHEGYPIISRIHGWEYRPRRILS